MTSPWTKLAAAQRTLSALAGGAPLPEEDRALDVDLLARWLVANGFGPLAFARSRHLLPELATRLAGDAYSVLAENTIHVNCLERIHQAFCKARLPVVLLKGAALAESAYGDLNLRPMTDVDIWVRGEQMPDALAILQQVGFAARENETRPLTLQQLSRGEVQLSGPNGGLVDVHWSPFPGWWLARVAAVDDQAVWSRIEALRVNVEGNLPSGSSEAQSECERYQLGAEDTVIQLAVHNAVNHQFGQNALRGLMDIVLTARTRSLDWSTVARRARRWKLATVVWLVIYLADRLIGLEEARPLLAQLQPSRVRRRLLERLIIPEMLLDGVDYRTSRFRYLLLLLLVDRPQDMLYLIYRTLWPEPEWMVARYQGSQSRLGHLWSVLRHGQI